MTFINILLFDNELYLFLDIISLNTTSYYK